MSDQSQGPGWWLASDGKYYPPEQYPGGQPPQAPQQGFPGQAPQQGFPGQAPQQGFPGQAPQQGFPGQAPQQGFPGQAPQTQYGNAIILPGIGQAYLASWGDRVIGAVWDMIPPIILGFTAGILFSVGSGMGGGASALFGVLGMLLWALIIGWNFFQYYRNGASGQSFGKKKTGLMCVSETTGTVIGGGMGIVRGLLHAVDAMICYVGYFLPLFDNKRQTISDKIVKTVVLKGYPPASFSDSLR